MNKWEEIPIINLYSDGGAEPNPGKGGFGVILSWKGKTKEIYQGFRLTTNNRMELLGIITGLEMLKTKSYVNIYTDSKYVINGIENGSAEKWKANNWINSNKKKSINIDLWSRLLELVSHHEVKFFWIKGHSGHPENELCDKMATLALNSKDLKIDIEYEKTLETTTTENSNNFNKRSKSNSKTIQEGENCKYCEIPLIKKPVIRKKLKANQSYYYEYTLICNQCKRIYLVDEAKVQINNNSLY